MSRAAATANGSLAIVFKIIYGFIPVENTTKETIADLMSHSQFHSITLILRHACGLILETSLRMTTGRINQVSIILSTPTVDIVPKTDTIDVRHLKPPRPKVIESFDVNRATFTNGSKTPALESNANETSSKWPYRGSSLMTANALGEHFPIVNQLDGRFAQAALSRVIATELESKRTSAQGFEGLAKNI